MNTYKGTFGDFPSSYLPPVTAPIAIKRFVEQTEMMLTVANMTGKFHIDSLLDLQIQLTNLIADGVEQLRNQ